MVEEPGDYHGLVRNNVGCFSIVTDDDREVVRIWCTPERTFFHRHRRLIYTKDRAESARIVGYWAPDHWLCLVVWDENRVEQIENFYGEHAVYGRLSLHESEIADAHRTGAKVVNG